MNRLRNLTLAAAVALLLALTAGCLPKPEEEIVYPTDPDSVLITMRTEPGPQAGQLERRAPAPEFTLYGDGSLIFIRPGEDGRGVLFRAQLPEDEVRDLLDFIRDQGFFDFLYVQPAPASLEDAAITFLYAQTRDTANASSASGLGEAIQGTDGATFRQYRRLEKIKARLDELDPEEAGGSLEGAYVPEAVLLLIRSDPGAASNDAAAWPFPLLPLRTFAPQGSGTVESRIEGETVPDLYERVWTGNPSLAAFVDQGRSYTVGLRPLLPFEDAEHFPEFEGQ